MIPWGKTQLAVLWSVIAVESWRDLDTILGILLSGVLLGEWVWAKLIRPACVRRKWLKPPRRRFYDE